jgi:hypothetical protein
MASLHNYFGDNDAAQQPRIAKNMSEMSQEIEFQAFESRHVAIACVIWRID